MRFIFAKTKKEKRLVILKKPKYQKKRKRKKKKQILKDERPCETKLNESLRCS
jgi:hypothetical protein